MRQLGSGARPRQMGLVVTAVAAAALGACAPAEVQPRAMTGADPGEGLRLIRQTGCGACHAIPGVEWPQGAVGPPLEGFAGRALIAGRHANQPETLAAFVRNAPSLSPRTGMPPMPLTEEEARHVAAYLYTLDDD